MPEMACPVAAAARSTPDALAIRSSGGNWTWAAWDEHARNVESTMRALGVTSGSRAAIVAANSREYLTLLVALWRIGALACPLNVRWPADRIASVVAHDSKSNAEAIHVSHGFADPGMELPFPFHPMTALEPSANMDASAAPHYDSDSRASVYFTSGSSGTPKAVLHRIGNHYANACASNRNIPLAHGGCWLLSLPMYHVAGMGVLWRCMVAGATIAVPEPHENLETALVRYGVTHVSVVTTQLQRLLGTAAGVRAARGLKAILLGGSAVPPALLDRARALQLPLLKSYGLTETASQVATTRPGDPPEALHTSGTPIVDDSVRISDDGHILVRGVTRFEGYLRGETLIQPFDADGWFDTGDIGAWTPEGYLRVTGRADNMFISGGENVHPEEIERELCRIEGVEEAVVAPVSDSEYGQRCVAFVRVSRPVPDLESPLRAMIPGYMIPKRFFPWPVQLVDADSKVNRARFREHAAALMAQDDRELPGLHQEAE